MYNHRNAPACTSHRGCSWSPPPYPQGPQPTINQPAEHPLELLPGALLENQRRALGR
jgi:hypothetical protein